MGRTEPSTARPPPQSFRRASRAKEARRTINKVIPALLASNYRARKGIRNVELIMNAYAWDPKQSAPALNGRRKGGSNVVASNTAAAVVLSANGREKKSGHGMNHGNEYGRSATGRNKKGTRRKKGDESSEDEETMEEIKAAKSAKEEKYVARMRKLEIGTKADQPLNVPKDQMPPKMVQQMPLQIKLLITDTITAASILQEEIRAANKKTAKSSNDQPRSGRGLAVDAKVNEIAVLNMASPLRPGGGFLTGATSQEEHLCMRTTLLPSLHEHFYRLPEFGVVYTPDVLVFRPGDRDRLKAGGHDLLRRRERFYIAIVTAAMLRYPDVVNSEDTGFDAVVDLQSSQSKYTDSKDRENVERKMQGVLAVIAGKGAQGAVLGAWGCGAYGNPIVEVVRAWKKVLASHVENLNKVASRGRDGDADGLRYFTFAVKDEKIAQEFARCWGEDLIAESLTDADRSMEPQIEVDEELERLIQERDELEEKIQELEQQLIQTKFPGRLEMVLLSLRKQLEVTKIAISERRENLGDHFEEGDVSTPGTDEDSTGDSENEDSDSDHHSEV